MACIIFLVAMRGDQTQAMTICNHIVVRSLSFAYNFLQCGAAKIKGNSSVEQPEIAGRPSTEGPSRQRASNRTVALAILVTTPASWSRLMRAFSHETDL